MKLMIALLLTGCGCVALGQTLGSQVPSHLQGMRSWYERQIQKVDQAYLRELVQARDTYRSSGQLESAKEVEAEMAQIQNRIPASTIIGKQHPANTAELMEFLHGTTWSIRYGTTTGDEEYQMTFNRKGTLTLNTGRVSKLQVYGPKTIRLWAYDTATMSDQFNYFTSVDCNGKLYYGVLIPGQTSPDS